MIRDNSAWSLAVGGLVIGLATGAIVRMTNFCSMGALADIHNFGNSNRFRAWMLALAVAILGVLVVNQGLGVDFSRSMYRPAMLPIGGAIIGGLLFGIGMVFAGGCVTRNLVRIGGGDLRALVVVLLTGIVAYASIGGLLAPLRMNLVAPLQMDLGAAGLPSQGIDSVVAAASGLPDAMAWNITALVCATVLAAWIFSSAAFRRSAMDIWAGLLIGLVITAGWALTGLAYDEFAATPAPLESLTFVRPAGDLVNWIMRYTAVPVPDFGITTALGTILGSAAVALGQRRFHLAGFSDSADVARSLGAAVLMGIGGVLALGCTFGQGITGLSTLALGSLLATASLIAGGFLGLRLLERLMEV
jgi:hypothetical protein